MAEFESELESFDESGEDYESFDEGSESESDESEFLGGILGSLPIVGPALSSLLSPPRPPLRLVPPPPSFPGVSAATLNTPRGNATIRLPEPLVTREELNKATADLRNGINRNTARLNTVQRDVTALSRKVDLGATQAKRDIGRVRAEVVKSRKQTSAAIARMKREASSQATMSMLIGIMSQKQVQTALDTHTHPFPHTHSFDTPTPAAVGTATTDPPVNALSGSTTTPSQSNSAAMLLPLMLMGGEGGMGGDSMMPMVMMMAFMR
jgi:hypothetical protein